MRSIFKRALALAMILGLSMLSSSALASHVHTYTAWAIITAPSCLSPGLREQHCTFPGCTSTITEQIPPSGHDYGPWQVESLATCTKGEVNVHTCNRCFVSERSTGAPLGHLFSPWSLDRVPTCTQNGLETRSCSRCLVTESHSIPALGHTYGAFVVQTPATCTQNGYETRSCGVCGVIDSRNIPASGHLFSPWLTITPATCTDSGHRERVCAVCGVTEIQHPSPLGHAFGPWNTLLAANCTTPGNSSRTCTRCLIVENRSLKPLGHAMGPYILTAPATCAMEGVKTSTCSRCGVALTKSLPKIKHKFSPWTVSVPSTCTVKGTQERTCTACGQVENRSLKLAAHQPKNQWIALRKPTLDQKGLKVKYCAVCDKIVVRQEYSLGSFRYDQPAMNFGVPLASLNPRERLAGNAFPLDLESNPNMEIPIVTQDGYFIGLILINSDENQLTLRYQLNDPNTLIKSDAFYLFADLSAINQESLGAFAPSYHFEESIPREGLQKGILVAKFTVSFDQKGQGVRAFKDRDFFTDGTSRNYEVVQTLRNRLTNP